ncbi:hypothetical protein [Streptomyces sp. YS415]|uniref:hypothetical protein n=1 Tax=Streptomyces sp. YS415 TaxID=2944806 RepID=UPI002021A654|nr:hypothetical protein [Streptomyces sp. YS415]MCL7423507.1 hypothetical protein [Streptomyces sp. YS415]
MTHRDIALLLAEAADEAEIGIAPTQAVLRGGRRRRARRWAVATATALVIAGSSGALAVAGLPGGDGGGSREVAVAPSVSADLLKPRSTALAVGRDEGKNWSVMLELWAPPQNEKEARAQLAAMEEFGMRPDGVERASELIGRTTYFVGRAVEGAYGEIEQGAFGGKPAVVLSETAVPLEPDTDGPARLVVGRLAKYDAGVICTWQDGTTTDLRRNKHGSDGTAITSVEGSPADWFVCLAPEDTAYESVGHIVPPLPRGAQKP